VKYEYYPLRYQNDLSSFDFISVGRYGEILKRVEFKPTETNNVFALSFGDVTESNEIDDLSISDNGDRNMVLSTIVTIVDQYTKRYPDRTIYFIASTDARTRLYRMVISLYWEELSAKYHIYVDTDSKDGWVPFRKGMKITAFSARRKVV
jgi:hypothetical protein